MNILILSCGTRNKIIQYFKNELKGKGKVIAADCSKLAPALYEADKYYIVPRLEDESYLNTILSICQENNIKGVLSLIDPELSVLAEYKEAFLNIGTLPIVSDHDIVELTLDKYEMFKYLVKNEINTVKSYIDKKNFYNDLENGLINFPVFVKPIKGSASININKASSKEEIEQLFALYDNLMIQEYMDGTEYGADVYVDMISDKLVAVFMKEKIKMRAGETDKSVSIKDEKLYKLIKEFVSRVKFKGIIDIDIFKVHDKYYISEVNPRFGGGYPHAYECGVNVPEMIVKNLKGEKNNINQMDYNENVYMMKFSDLKISEL